MAVPIVNHTTATEAQVSVGNGSSDGQHRRILAWSPSGTRVEYDIEGHALILWCNPQAGKSDELRLRYFSNRDDHTTLFDRIRFNGLDPDTFERCDYDPYHMMLHFGGQRLHIVPHPDRPVVGVWSEGAPLLVDLKADKQDTVGRWDERVFTSMHPDRGLGLLFVAALGAGSGTFWQLPTDPLEWRSAHTRVTLEAGQLLVLAGDLAHEPLVPVAERYAESGAEAFSAEVNALVEAETVPGRLEFTDAFPEARRMEALVDLNRRLMLSFQDRSGPIWDGPRSIYCHLWVRAGLNAPLAEWAGLSEMTRRFARFALKTPSVMPDGRMFGQMFGPYGKFQEDGLFYATWAQHCRWLQTGEGFDATGISVLLDALDWLDRRCWDAERGLYGRFFACETPFEGTRDVGWDAPVGMPASWPPARMFGKNPVRSYDIYVNLLQYAVLRMLAPHVSPATRRALLEKCERIDAGLSPLWEHRDGVHAAPYGWMRFSDGSEELVMDGDHTDQVWALTIPPFTPPAMPVERIRTEQAERVAGAIGESGMGRFLFAYTCSMLAADPAFRDPRETLAEFASLLPEIERSARYFPMPGAVPECVHVEDGDLFHDIRPCAFAVGQWIPVAYGMGIRRSACTWALRGTDALRRIAVMRLGRASAEILWEPAAPICGLRLDGKPLAHTLVLPLDALGDGHHRIEVGGEPGPGPILVETEAALLRVECDADEVRYHLRGHGPCRCRFADGQSITLTLDGEGLLKRLKTSSKLV